MIRPLTCICMLLAAGSGLYLYQTKHRAQMLDREIARTYKQIDSTKERIAALKGEWAGLNETERLAELAQQHLALQSLDPKQFAAMADLGARLPAPLPPGAVQQAEAPPPATAAAIAVAAAPPVATPAPARPAPARPVTQMANLTPPAPRPGAAAPAVKTAVAPTAEAVPRFLAPVVNVSAPGMTAPQPIHQAVAQSIVMPASAPGIGESVARAAQMRMDQTRMDQNRANPTRAAQPQPAQAAAPRTALASNSPPVASALGSSALGGLRGVALPAPVPFAAAANR